MLNREFIKETGVLKWLFRFVFLQIQKRIFRRPQSMRLPTGLNILLPVDSSLASEVYITKADIDWGSEKLLARLVKRQGCFLDVGANIGYYTVYFSPLFQCVFSFEPDPRPRKTLVSNTANLNNVEIVPCAVAAYSGSTRFELGNQSEISHITMSADQGIEVPVVSIDDFVEERGLTVEAIKTDIEGFDLDALKGATNTLRSQRPIVLSELQPVREVIDFAQSISYSIFAFGREKESRMVTFVRIGDPECVELVYKMLFLVPKESEGDIVAAAALM